MSVLVSTPAQALTEGSITGRITLDGHAPDNTANYSLSAVTYWSDGVDGGVFPSTEQVTKGADGQFTITHLPPGQYTLKASATAQASNGTVIVYATTYTGGASSTAGAQFFQVDAGTEAQSSLNLKPSGQIHGIVRDASGAPMPNAKVGIWTAGTGYTMSSYVTSTSTASDGSYTSYVSPGAYKVGFTNSSSTVGYNYDDHTYGLNAGINGLSNQWWDDRPSYATSKSVLINAASTNGGVNATLKSVKSTSGGITQVSSYVALGDSYQSGEGANPRRPGQPSDQGFYYPSTDTNINKCHRAYTAYPELLHSDGLVQGEFESWACSGSLTSDLTTKIPNPNKAPWDDPLLTGPNGTASLDNPQSAIDRLTQDNPDLVTIGIGGNDMGFSDVLAQCVHSVLIGSCANDHNEQMLQRMAQLQTDGAWRKLFSKVRAAAPHPHVAVLGYSHFYNETDTISACPDTGVRRSDQIWINYIIKQLDDTIRSEAAAAGFQYIDVYGASTGHELCQGPDDERYMNGIMLNVGDNSLVWPESYHPTPFGHRILANIVENALAGPSDTAPESTTLHSGESVDYRLRVPGGSPAATFSITADEGVTPTLTSPSGEQVDISAQNPSVKVNTDGELQEIQVVNPLPGAWKISLSATTAVPAAGASVDVASTFAPVPNPAPVAVISSSPDEWDPSVVNFSATQSHDDGWIAKYLWDFGDGTTGSGVSVQHQYAQPGTYHPTLVIQDGSGAMGFAESDQPVHVPETLMYQRKPAGSSTSELRYTNDVSAFDYRYFDESESADQSEPAMAPTGALAYVSHSADDDSLRSAPDGDGVYRSIATETHIHAPSWSPDGSKLAFAGTDDQGTGIFIVPSDGSTAPQRLTTADQQGTDGPTWSPDGSEIAYARSAASGTSEIIKVPTSGGAPVTLASGENFAAPDWSPDGAQLAYVGKSPQGSPAIFVMDADGSNKRQVTHGSAPAGAPAWSPSGKQIAYTVDNGTDSDIWLLDVASGTETALLVSTDDESSPTWMR